MMNARYAFTDVHGVILRIVVQGKLNIKAFGAQFTQGFALELIDPE